MNELSIRIEALFISITHSFVFLSVHNTMRIYYRSFVSNSLIPIPLHPSLWSSVHNQTLPPATQGPSLVASLLQARRCNTPIPVSVLPQMHYPFANLDQISLEYSTSSLTGEPRYWNASICSNRLPCTLMSNVVPLITIVLVCPH